VTKTTNTATSSGGYGSSTNVWSQRSQRGFDNTESTNSTTPGLTGGAATLNASEKERSSDVGKSDRRENASQNETGLIDQSLSGGNLKGEMQDATSF